MAENGSAKYNGSSSGSRTHYSIAKLLLLGLVFHVVYLRSVFDCYFTSPVVQGMKYYGATPEEAKAPAKRLVLIVGVF
jgi:phosphatidylinositol glycan class N